MLPSSLAQALRSTAHAWLESPSLPWGVLRDLCAAVRNARRQAQGSSTHFSAAGSSNGSTGGASKAAGPWLHELCRGGGVELPPPPARAKTKSPELQAHLEKLRRKLEQDSYDRMVRDVTQKVCDVFQSLLQGRGAVGEEVLSVYSLKVALHRNLSLGGATGNAL